MMRLTPAAAAVVLFVVPLAAAPGRVVAVPGVAGLLLVVLGIATRWRWPTTAAACVLAADYALALALTDAAVSVVGAAAVGLALLLLLQSTELARGARHATVDARVVRSQAAGWIGLAAVTLGSAAVTMTLARGAAAAIPFTAAPIVAAAAALGVVLALAAALTRRLR